MKNETETPAVKIFLATTDQAFVRKTLAVIEDGTFVYADNRHDADLIIFTEIRGIIEGYRRDKFYAFLKRPNVIVPVLPANCIVIDPLNTAIDLYVAISNVQNKIMFSAISVG
jgi:hypothetical protein